MKINNIIKTETYLLFICEDGTIYKHIITETSNIKSIFKENYKRFSIIDEKLNFFNENCFPFLFIGYFCPIEKIENITPYLHEII